MKIFVLSCLTILSLSTSNLALTSLSVAPPPNNLPVVVSNVNFSTCGELYYSPMFRINITDADFDNITFAGATCSNPAVITANIMYEEYPISGGKTFIFFINSTEQNLNETLSIQFTDGIGITTHNHNLITPSGMNITTNTASLCSNGELIDLSTYQLTQNGVWRIAGTPNAIDYFDPTTFVSGGFENVIYSKIVNGCMDNDTLGVTINDAPQINITPTNATSCGAANGNAIATVSGGAAPFIHYWNHGVQNDFDAINLNPGTFVFRLTDANGCKALGIAEIQANDFTLSGTSTNLTCFESENGTITPVITGGIGPFLYTWSNGAGSPTLTNASAGNHHLVLTDANGCKISSSWTLYQPEAMVLTAFPTSPSSCGASDGELNVTCNTEAVPTGFAWTNTMVGDFITGLTSGFYTVTVTDNAGCIATKTFALSDASGIAIQADVQRPNCGLTNGMVDVTPMLGTQSGAATVSQILWENGGTNEDKLNVGPGVYTCSITGSDGCKSNFGWVLNAKRPAKNDICLVTVDTASTTNIVIWEKPIIPTIDYYKIYREVGTSGVFQLIDTVHYESLSIFNDVIASPVERSWRYKISAVNDCGIEGPLSNRFKTMNISVNPGTIAGDYNVTWDEYEGQNVVNYDVYRKTTNSSWTLIQTVGASQFLYVDTPPEILGLDYMIELNFTVPCVPNLNKSNDYNYTRSNKERGIFNAGSGTGDNSNGIITFENGAKLMIYPNPADENLTIETDNGSIKSIQILDATGKLIANQSLSLGKTVMDVSYLAPGIYFIPIQDKNDSKQLIFIKK